jgi:hypothetical protein
VRGRPLAPARRRLPPSGQGANAIRPGGNPVTAAPRSLGRHRCGGALRVAPYVLGGTRVPKNVPGGTPTTTGSAAAGPGLVSGAPAAPRASPASTTGELTPQEPHPCHHRCGSSDVSIRVAGRVVLVMHLIAFRRLQAGPADHHDGALPWSEPPRCSTVVVAPGRHRVGTGPGLGPGLGPGPGMPVRRAAAARPPSARVPAARLRRKSPRPLTSLRKSRTQVASGQNINFPIVPIGKMGNGEGARRIFG